MEINILVLDTDPVHSLNIKDLFVKLGYNLLDLVDNASDAVAALYASDPDLLIIEVGLKEKANGFEVAKKNMESGLNARPVIFITDDKSDQMFELAKRYKPCAYFIKPFDKYLIKYAIELAVNKSPDNPKINLEKNIDKGVINSDNLFIRKTKKIVKVPLTEVQYIEVESKYSTLHTNMGKFLIRISLVELMEKLPSNSFIRVHRNYIVNLNAIVEFDYDECTVHLKSGSVPMGRSYKNSIADQLVMLS
jgi:two-component system, LytTR family, response regulator